MANDLTIDLPKSNDKLKGTEGRTPLILSYKMSEMDIIERFCELINITFDIRDDKGRKVSIKKSTYIKAMAWLGMKMYAKDPKKFLNIISDPNYYPGSPPDIAGEPEHNTTNGNHPKKNKKVKKKNKK